MSTSINLYNIDYQNMNLIIFNNWNVVFEGRLFV